MTTAQSADIHDAADDQVTLKISNADARSLLLNKQGLGHKPTGPFNADRLQDLIGQLGYVQLDSINTVERAHHMILHSRADGYRHKHLKELHEERGTLFEHWTHDACLIPTEFYPYWRHRFSHARERLNHPNWQKRLGPDGAKVVKAVKARIKKEGPLMSRDFEDKGQGAWWGWGPSKTALEYLWRAGELAIVRRDGFQKVYDLTNRCIEDCHLEEKPSLKQTIDWKCREALKRLGTATHGEIAAYWASVSNKQAADWVTKNLGRDLIPVEIEGSDRTCRKAVAFASIENDLEALRTPSKRLRLLSPFDPIVRDRKRAERLFGFDYRVEIFVPEKKRQYGYYVLPILEGAKFTGRTDIKVHRKEGRVEVKGLWLENGIKLSAAREEGLRKALARLTKFTGAETFDLDAALQRAKASPSPDR